MVNLFFHDTENRRIKYQACQVYPCLSRVGRFRAASRSVRVPTPPLTFNLTRTVVLNARRAKGRPPVPSSKCRNLSRGVNLLQRCSAWHHTSAEVASVLALMKHGEWRRPIGWDLLSERGRNPTHNLPPLCPNVSLGGTNGCTFRGEPCHAGHINPDHCV